jgi:hypothetical protein
MIKVPIGCPMGIIDSQILCKIRRFSELTWVRGES